VRLSVVFYPVMSLLILLFLFTQEGDQNCRSVIFLYLTKSKSIEITDKLFLVVAADGLAKLDVFRLPDPFAVIMVDSEQTHTTSVIQRTLNPYWNEHFDVSVFLLSDLPCPWF
jgi:hypothetical protein